jgi:hypothetical protein
MIGVQVLLSTRAGETRRRAKLVVCSGTGELRDLGCKEPCHLKQSRGWNLELLELLAVLNLNHLNVKFRTNRPSSKLHVLSRPAMFACKLS